MKRLFLSLAAMLVIGVPAVAYFLAPDSLTKFSARGDRATFAARIVQVRRVQLPRHLKVAGELAPVERIEILSRLPGTVSELRCDVGDLVSAGTLVAVIYSRDLNDRLARQEAAISAAEDELKAREHDSADAEKLSVSRRELARQDLIARREIGDAEAALETARAAADLARAHLAQQQAMLSQVHALRSLTRLTAPIGGQVIRRHVELGAALGESAAIFTLAGLDRLRLTFNPGAADAIGIDPGARVRIAFTTFPSKVFEGEIQRIAPLQSTAEPQIEIQIDNRQRLLRSGMVVEASIEMEAPNDALLVPRAAVISQQHSSYVYKVQPDGIVRQPIVTGPQRSAEVVVTSGLTEGDSVVADASDRNVRMRAGRRGPAR